MRFRTVFFYLEGGAPTSTEDATSSVSQEVQGGQEVGVGTRIPAYTYFCFERFSLPPFLDGWPPAPLFHRPQTLLR